MTWKKKMILTKEWDKTFPQSDKVEHSKVTFRNRYGITLAADLYKPKHAEGKLAAIAVCGPFGAVKEQAAGLYAQTMAERGFLTIAFDPSFTGESGGQPGIWHPRISIQKISQAAVRSSLYAGRCESREDRDHRHLRMGRDGPECRCPRYPDQGHGGLHHV